MTATLADLYCMPANRALLDAIYARAPLKGVCICITGTLSIERAVAQEMLVQAGARIVGEAAEADWLLRGRMPASGVTRKEIDARREHVRFVPEVAVVEVMLELVDAIPEIEPLQSLC